MMSGVCGMKAEACEMKRPGKDAPIGVFDSGVGGISVLRKMISLMPNENYIYYGDSANAPYGDRSDEEVLSLTENVFDYLLSEGVKGIVVACNTATSVAVRRLRGRYPDLPIVGIEPAIKPAAKNHEGGRIVVMATSVTLRRPKFAHLMESFRQSAEIISMACPSIVDFVEKDKMNSQAIQKAAGPQAVLYDGSEGVAREIRRRLAEKNLLADADNSLNLEIINSSGPEMVALTKRLLVV